MYGCGVRRYRTPTVLPPRARGKFFARLAGPPSAMAWAAVPLPHIHDRPLSVYPGTGFRMKLSVFQLTEPEGRPLGSCGVCTACVSPTARASIADRVSTTVRESLKSQVPLLLTTLMKPPLFGQNPGFLGPFQAGSERVRFAVPCCGRSRCLARGAHGVPMSWWPPPTTVPGARGADCGPGTTKLDATPVWVLARPPHLPHEAGMGPMAAPGPAWPGPLTWG